jgi:hypothetical protein
MTTTDLDMAAIMAKANDALAQPTETTAAGVLAAHSCQTGCGRIANVVMIRLADSDLDILCDVCAMMMWLAVADAAVPATEVDDQAPAPDDAGIAAPAASAPES